MFEPEIVLLLFQQIQNAANLQLVKTEGTTRVYHDIKEEEILKKSYQITKQYHYDVTKNEKEFICTCMYPKTMELPCSHIIKYCADTGTSLHLDFCKHWGIKPLNDVSFEITNTTIEEIAKLRKNIDSIKKNKKIAGEIQQLVIQKSNANIQHLRSTIDKIKKINWIQSREMFCLFQQLKKTVMDKVTQKTSKPEQQTFYPFSESKLLNQQYINKETNDLMYFCLKYNYSAEILENVYSDFVKNKIQEERRVEQERGEERRVEQERGEEGRVEQERGEEERGEEGRGGEGRGEEERGEEGRGGEERGEEERGEEGRVEQERGEEGRVEEPKYQLYQMRKELLLKEKLRKIQIVNSQTKSRKLRQRYWNSIEEDYIVKVNDLKMAFRNERE